MGYYPQESLYKPYKYHGYTVRGTPICQLLSILAGSIASADGQSITMHLGVADLLDTGIHPFPPFSLGRSKKKTSKKPEGHRLKRCIGIILPTFIPQKTTQM